MYRWRQISEFLRLTALGLTMFSVMNVTMWLATAAWPDLFWVPKQFFGVDFVRENYQRVQGAKAYFRDRAAADERLVVILGLSSASEGVSVEQLAEAERQRGGTRRFLSLSGAGRNARELAIYARPLIDSELDADLVVLAINPFHLMDPSNASRETTSVLRQYTTLELLFGWFAAKRGDLRHIFDMEVLRARTALFESLGNRVDERQLDPWRENTFMGMIGLTRPEQWQRKLQEYGDRGYYDVANYANSRQQPAIAAALLQALESAGMPVIIVLMPEHSSLRQAIPAEALPVTLAKLRAHTDNIPRVVDLRDAIADEHFNDISHMKAEGRAAFTAVLEQLISNGQPIASPE